MLLFRLKTSKNFKPAIAVLIVIILIGAGIYAYTAYQPKEEKTEEITKEPYDKVGPDVLQSVYLTIHRIRKKGIIDHMENAGLFPNIFKNIKNQRISDFLEGMRPGIGWDEKPTFSYVATLYDYTETGRDIYKDWDTGYINQVIWRKVEDEQLTADVDLTIIEHQTQKKLLRSITTKKEMDAFKVTYDFKTGRWSGDDSFNDTDGYGHYNGDNYEIWFTVSQNSEDGDVIPYWTEYNILGTDPEVDDTNLDPDGDGIPTVWEWKWGYDPLVYDNHSILDPDLDGLQNTEEYKMAKWLANPYHQEIYLEVDNMAQTPKKLFNRDGYDGWEHEFYFESQQMLIDRFAQHNIAVHIDDGRMGEGGETLPFGRGNNAYEQDSGVVAGFYKNNFNDERKGIFRYVVVAYGGGWCHPQDEKHWYDCMTVPHNQNFFKNQLSGALSDRTIRIGQAIQVMHELGHSLGFLYAHTPGVDNTSLRHPDVKDYPWFDYKSCMNYDYFMQRLFDYSDGTNGPNDTDDWSAVDLTFFQRSSPEMEGLGAL